MKNGLAGIVSDQLIELDLENVCTESLDLWLPFDMHDFTSIMPVNIIVVAGGPDAGKSAFELNVIKGNIKTWRCHYFNSEMGPEELRIRLDLFGDFLWQHKNFHAYERSIDFQDVIRTGKYTFEPH